MVGAGGPVVPSWVVAFPLPLLVFPLWPSRAVEDAEEEAASGLAVLGVVVVGLVLVPAVVVLAAELAEGVGGSVPGVFASPPVGSASCSWAGGLTPAAIAAAGSAVGSPNRMVAQASPVPSSAAAKAASTPSAGFMASGAVRP